MTDTGRRSGGLAGGEFAGLGLQFALVILVFTGAGYWLDRRLGSSPVFLLIGVAIGGAGGFYSIFQKATAAQRRDADRRTAERAERDAKQRSEGP